MELIRELLNVSAYRPSSGYSRELMELAKVGVDRKEAFRRWKAMGRSDSSFYTAYKALKDDLIRLAFLDWKSASDIEERRMFVWQKYETFQKLMIAQKKAAAVELAIELMSGAKRTGFTEIVVGLASMLEGHFGSIEIDSRRYLRYRKIRKDYTCMMEEELEVKALLARLVFHIERKKDLSQLEREMEALSIKQSKSFTFMRFRFSALSVWYNLKGNFEQMRSLFRETVSFYEKCEVDLPSGVLTGLYSQIMPQLVERGLYAEAEAHLSKALRLTREGTHNWHLFMLQKACLGLVSGKKGIVKASCKKASLPPREHNNPEIDKRWEVVQRLAAEGENEFEKVWGAVF